LLSIIRVLRLFLKYHKLNRELSIGGGYFLIIIRVWWLFFKYHKVNRELSFGGVVIF